MLSGPRRPLALALATGLAAARGVGAVAGPCLPAWASAAPDGRVTGTCPYGRALPGDVSWSSQLYDESLIELYVSLFYSYIPYFVVALMVTELLLTRGTRALHFASFASIIVAVNELVWKHLIHQPRPVGSCLLDCGMPSSHSMISIGLATLLFLDLAFRICPTDVEAFGLQLEATAECEPLQRVRKAATVLRVSNSRALSNVEFVWAVAAWLLLLGPVPVSRIVLRDHSPAQVAVGAGIGFLEAVLWFVLVRRLSWVHRDALGAPWPSEGFCLLRHDCGVPRHDMLVERLLADPAAAKQAFHAAEAVGNAPAAAAAKEPRAAGKGAAPVPAPLLVGTKLGV